MRIWSLQPNLVESTQKALMAELVRKQLITLQQFMSKVEEFMNQEETISALLESKQSLNPNQSSINSLGKEERISRK
jgi:hypothetical protein